MQRHALFIDAMGTLVGLRDPAPRLVSLIAGRVGVAIELSDARAALAAEIAYYRAHLHEGRDAETCEGLRRRCAAVLRDALPGALTDVPVPALAELLVDALRFQVFPDARELVVRARRAGARVIVVSNWDASLGEALERVGVAPLLDGVLTSAAVGAAKPDPAIFTAALVLGGAAPAHSLHVGDSAEADLAGARAAGIPAVLLDRTGTEPASAGARTISTLHALDLSSWR